MNIIKNKSIHRGLSLLLSMAMLFSVLIPVQIAAEPITAFWTDGLTEQPAGYADYGNGIISVSTPEALAWVSVLVGGLNEQTADSFEGKTIMLLNNIDLSNKQWVPIGRYSTTTNKQCFKGIFDGNNFTVSNLYLTTPFSTAYRYPSLFGGVEDGIVKNVHNRNVYINTSHLTGTYHLAGIVGYLLNSVLENCTVTGTLTAYNTRAASGITNTVSESHVSKCAFSGILDGNNNSGIASSVSGTIDQCFAEIIPPENPTYVPLRSNGIASTFTTGKISNSYSIGTAISIHANNAGIVGEMFRNSIIENSYSATTVQSGHRIGGIVGFLKAATSVVSDDPAPVISGCVALNDVITANGYSGGSGSSIGRIVAMMNEGKMSDGTPVVPDLNMNYAYKGMQTYSRDDSGKGEVLRLIGLPSDDCQTTGKEGEGISSADIRNGYWPVDNWNTDIWHFEAGKLPTLKNIHSSFEQRGEIPDYITESSEADWNITAFDDISANEYEVPLDTSAEDVLPLLGTVVFAVKDGETPVSIPDVTWVSTDYNSQVLGNYTFTAVTPDGYIINASLPEATVKVILTHTVSFVTNGGSDVASVEISHESLLTAPSVPIRARYIFNGWHKDEELTQPWDYANDLVTGDITLYAKWATEYDDFYASQAGEYTDSNIDLSAYPLASILYITNERGIVDGAVVEANPNDPTKGIITFKVHEAGSYVYSMGKMVIGATMTGTSQGSDNLIANAYSGDGSADNPWVVLADLAHYLNNSSIFGTTWISLCNWAGYYAPSGQMESSDVYDESLTRNITFETRDNVTGKLVASINIDGTSGQRERIKHDDKAPFTLSFRVNPTEADIASWLNSNTLYTDADRKSAMQAKAEEVVNNENQTLITFDEARELFGPVTLKLDASLHGFSPEDELRIVYLGGTGGGQYHGVLPPLADRLANEMSYTQYYNDTVSVDENGYAEFVLYNRGMFQLAKADDVSIITDIYVSFESNGGSSVATVKAVDGVIQAPTNPTRTGYNFGDWYTEESLTNVFDFNTVLTQSITLYAKWIPSGGSGGNTGGTTSYTVTFVTGNDPDTGNPNATINSQTVNSGGKATDPGFVDSGYGYLPTAWYTDSALTNEYNFNNSVSSNLTLYPKWIRYILKNDLKNDGGSGTQSSPYLGHLANSRQSKIAWKALNVLAEKAESEWWKVFATYDNNVNGTIKYSWLINSKEIENCNIAHPYYTDISVSKKSSTTVQADFVWRTAIEGKVKISLNVSEYIKEGSDVAISYVNGSCDGMVAHTNVETGEWVDSLHHPSSYYGGGTSKVENGFITFELTHGGSFLLTSSGVINETTGGGGGTGGGGTTITIASPTTVNTESSVSINPEVEAKDGMAEVAISDAEVNTAVDSAVSKNAGKIVIAPTVKGEAGKISFEVSRTSLADITNKTKASVVFDTDIADISLSPDVLAKIANASGDKVVITIEKISEDTVKLEIKLDDELLKDIGMVKFTVPLQSEVSGMVAAIVKEDGSEEIIKKSAVIEGNLSVMIDSSATIRIKNNTKTFHDIDDSFWGKNAVAFATSRMLFNGVSETEFGTEASMTRSMLVTVLHRLEDTPEGNGVSFDDVEKGSWYEEAVAWAAENSIVSGTGNGFDPNGNITREQLAAIMYRYAKFVGIDVSGQGELAQFSDREQMSDWATEAMNWAVGSGLITGKGDNVLDPSGNATRAEVAVIIQRFIVKIMD